MTDQQLEEIMGHYDDNGDYDDYNNHDDYDDSSDDYYDPYVVGPQHITNLTTGQQIALCLLALPTSIPSIICSVMLMKIVYNQSISTARRRGNDGDNSGCISNIGACISSSSPYSRILFMFSFVDIISTLNYIVGPFLLPTKTSFRYWSFGNATTCNISGAIFTFGYSTLWYYFSLSVYFLLTVRFQIKQNVMAKYYEPILHIWSLGFPLSGTLWGLITGDFNFETSVGRRCAWSDRKELCTLPEDINEAKNMGMNKCVKVTLWYGLSGNFFMVMMGLAILSVIMILANNLVLYLYVRRTTYSASARGGIRGSISTIQVRRVRDVATQAFLYVAALLITCGGFFVTSVLDVYDVIMPNTERTWFLLLAYQQITLPSIGIMNFLIYLRPTYMRTRRQFPNETKLWAVRRTIYGEHAIKPTTNNQKRKKKREDGGGGYGDSSMISSLSGESSSLSSWFSRRFKYHNGRKQDKEQLKAKRRLFENEQQQEQPLDQDHFHDRSRSHNANQSQADNSTIDVPASLDFELYMDDIITSGDDSDDGEDDEEEQGGTTADDTKNRNDASYDAKATHPQKDGLEEQAIVEVVQEGEHSEGNQNASNANDEGNNVV